MEEQKKQGNWFRRHKIVTGILVFLLIGIIAASTSDESQSDNSASSDTQKSANLSEEEQIKQVVADRLSGKSQGKEYIREITVTPQVDGGYGVLASYNAKYFEKKLINEEMTKVYKALYTSDKDVRTATIQAYHEVNDQYGKSIDGVVYKTTLDKSTADKINFDANSHELYASILPNAWQIVSINQNL